MTMLIGQIGLAQTIQKQKNKAVQSDKEPYLMSREMVF